MTPEERAASICPPSFFGDSFRVEIARAIREERERIARLAESMAGVEVSTDDALTFAARIREGR